MSENTQRKDDGRVSRLSMVRSGGAAAGSLKMPPRGRQYVDIDLIVPDPRNERKTFRGIDELAASIKKVGVIEAPTVVPTEGGRYMLTTGERRWRAAKKAGLKQIHVIIGEPEEEKGRRVKSLISNVQREDLSALELAQALSDMKEENGDVKTNRDLASLVGKTEQWVGQMLKLLSLPDGIQTELKKADRVIPYESVLQIARIEDEAAQKELLKGVLAGETVRQIREKAKSAKSESKRTGKGTIKSTQKLQISNGWVIIHCEKKNAKKDDYITALQEALKTARQLDI